MTEKLDFEQQLLIGEETVEAGDSETDKDATKVSPMMKKM